MLNQAWTFSVIAQIAFYAGFAFALAALVVLGTLIFEVAEIVTRREEVEAISSSTTDVPGVTAAR
jgi:hypothetical protein